MSFLNVHKAILGSQLSIFYMGSFSPVRPRPKKLSKRVDTDTLKTLARTILHGHPHDQNKGPRESRENELHERAQR